MTNCTIRLRNVSRAYRDSYAVRDLSLDVNAGEFLTLLGPSGCGKTTTLMLIAGFQVPSAGEILFDGRPVTHLPPHLREQGFVFQHYALFPHLTVRENLAYPLRVRGIATPEARKRVDRLLERFSLAPLAERYPGQLSGGQQQRTALARALIYDPPLLLMDEPLAALDRNLRTQLQRDIKALQREFAVTIVYVTHDQEEALTMSDRIAVMRGGSLEQLDTPENLYERPRTEFVARFMGEMNVLPATAERIEGADLLARSDRGLQLRAPVLEAVPAGARVQLAMRPERILLASSPSAGGFRWLEGVIEKHTYLGESDRYELQVQGHVLTAQQQRCARNPRFACGERVFAAWSDRDVQILRTTGATT